jgi:hypothetical protein
MRKKLISFLFFQVAVADYPGNELHFRVVMQCRQFDWVVKSIGFYPFLRENKLNKVPWMIMKQIL